MKKTIEFLKEIEKETEKKIMKYENYLEKRKRKTDQEALDFFVNKLGKIQDCFIELEAK